MTDQAGVQVSGATGDLDDDEGGGLVGFNFQLVSVFIKCSFSSITVVWSMNYAYSNPLQRTWIEVDTLASKQGLRIIFFLANEFHTSVFSFLFLKLYSWLSRVTAYLHMLPPN